MFKDEDGNPTWHTHEAEDGRIFIFRPDKNKDLGDDSNRLESERWVYYHDVGKINDYTLFVIDRIKKM